MISMIKDLKNLDNSKLERRKNRTRKNIKMFLNEGNYQVAEIYNRELVSINNILEKRKHEL